MTLSTLILSYAMANKKRKEGVLFRYVAQVMYMI
jgi:hypothetical protein